MILFAASFTFFGCAYSYSPIAVEVRSWASHEVEVGATVRISNTHVLNPSPPRPAQGVTDDSGRVVLDVGIYNDLVVRVTPTSGVEHIFSIDQPSLTGSTGWIRPVRTKGGGEPTIEARFSPTSHPTPLTEPSNSQNIPND